MKKIKVIALIMAMVCAACMFVGCGSVKWDDIKNKDVVATVNETEITKLHVKYFYAENVVSAKVTANMFSQMGIDQIEEEENEESAFYDALSYYIVGELARANGMGITEEEAYEKAYEEYVLMEKKPGYEYIVDFNNQIKEMLYFDSDKLVAYASEKLYNSVPAMDYIESLLDEMQYDYPEDPDFQKKDDALIAAVAERLAKEAKGVEIKLNYHSKKVLDKVPYGEIVKRASTTFTRTEK